MSERDRGGQKEKLVMKSRLFKTGAVVALIGAGFGIGLLVKLGASSALGGAGWTWAFENPKGK